MSAGPAAKTTDAVDPRIERAAKALAWSELSPRGRETVDWLLDFSEGERRRYRVQVAIVLEAVNGG